MTAFTAVAVLAAVFTFGVLLIGVGIGRYTRPPKPVHPSAPKRLIPTTAWPVEAYSVDTATDRISAVPANGKRVPS